MYSHDILPIFIEIQPSSTMGKRERELVALLGLSFWLSPDCCVALTYSAMGLSEFVTVVFPDHTHYFYKLKKMDIVYCIIIYKDY